MLIGQACSQWAVTCRTDTWAGLPRFEQNPVLQRRPTKDRGNMCSHCHPSLDERGPHGVLLIMSESPGAHSGYPKRNSIWKNGFITPIPGIMGFSDNQLSFSGNFSTLGKVTPWRNLNSFIHSTIFFKHRLCARAGLTPRGLLLPSAECVPALNLEPMHPPKPPNTHTVSRRGIAAKQDQNLSRQQCFTSHSDLL